MALDGQDLQALMRSAAPVLDRPLEGQALPETLPWMLMSAEPFHSLQDTLLPLQVLHEYVMQACPWL